MNMEIEEVKPLYLLEDEISLESYLEETNRYLVAAHADELFIDVDSVNELEEFRNRYTRVVDIIDVLGEVIERESKTKLHYHVIVKLKHSLPVVDRILLQAILGSDWRKESLSYVRVMRDIENPIRFFEERK